MYFFSILVIYSYTILSMSQFSKIFLSVTLNFLGFEGKIRKSWEPIY